MPPHRRHRVPRTIAFTDDAGVTHKVSRMAILEGADEQTRYVYGLAMRQVEQAFSLKTGCLFGAIYGLAMGGSFALLGAALPIATKWISYFIPISVACLTAVFIQGYYRRQFRKQEHQVADVMLSNGLCPTCLYRVAGTPPDANAHVVCAECGAAWDASRVHERAVVAPAGEKPLLDHVQPRRGYWSHRWLRDATGARHALLDADFQRSIRLAAAEEHAQRLIAVRRELRRSALPRRVLAAVLALPVSGFFGLMGVLQIQSHFPPTTTMAIFMCIGGLWFICMGWFLAMIFLNLRGHSANKRTAVRVMLENDLCPSCGEDLRPVQVSSEDPRQCPRCTARWLNSSDPTPARGNTASRTSARRCPTCARTVQESLTQADGRLVCPQCATLLRPPIPVELRDAVAVDDGRWFCVGCGKLTQLGPAGVVARCNCTSCGRAFVARQPDQQQADAGSNPVPEPPCPDCGQLGVVQELVTIARCPDCQTTNAIARRPAGAWRRALA